MPRQPKEIQVVHASADYYEPLLRARFVRAMKKLQLQTSINQLALSLTSVTNAQSVIPTSSVEAALVPLKKVLIDAYMRGGKLGAAHLVEMLKRG